MKYFFLTFFVSIIPLLCLSQIFVLKDCDSIHVSEKLELSVSGMIDHSFVNKTWIKEEIYQDSLMNWPSKYSNNFVDQMFSRSIYTDEVIERMGITWEEFRNKQYKKTLLYTKSILESALRYYKKGDILVFYSTPFEMWQSLSGQEGIWVIRNCTVVFTGVLTQS